MSYQSDHIRQISQWETDHNPKDCICRGGGWWLSPYDTWQQCGIVSHRTQPHPESDEYDAQFLSDEEE